MSIATINTWLHVRYLYGHTFWQKWFSILIIWWYGVQFVKVDKTNNLSVYKQFVINVKDYFDEPTNKENHIHLKNANWNWIEMFYEQKIRQKKLSLLYLRMHPSGKTLTVYSNLVNSCFAWFRILLPGPPKKRYQILFHCRNVFHQRISLKF